MKCHNLGCFNLQLLLCSSCKVSNSFCGDQRPKPCQRYTTAVSGSYNKDQFNKLFEHRHMGCITYGLQLAAAVKSAISVAPAPTAKRSAIAFRQNTSHRQEHCSSTAGEQTTSTSDLMLMSTAGGPSTRQSTLRYEWEACVAKLSLLIFLCHWYCMTLSQLLSIAERGGTPHVLEVLDNIQSLVGREKGCQDKMARKRQNTKVRLKKEANQAELERLQKAQDTAGMRCVSCLVLTCCLTILLL